MLRTPVSGSFVKTSGSVMKGPPSSGQHFRIGSSSSVPSRCTISWHGASFTVFGIRSRSRATIGSIFSASMIPAGICGVISWSISLARSSSVFTPSARHMRSIDPKTFAATGMSKPAGFSKRSAGPPPGDLHARSMTAAISRSGLTGLGHARQQPALVEIGEEVVKVGVHGSDSKPRSHEDTKNDPLVFLSFVPS